MDYTAFSVGLYSTWFYHAPERLLFDAGEGVATSFANGIFAFDKIFLSHGHTDHVAGLPTLVNTRNLARGDKKKALTIYYPKGNTHVQDMQQYIEKSQARLLTYPLKWVGVAPNQSIPLENPENPRHCDRTVLAFPTVHGNAPSLGYVIREKRKRLKPQYSGLSGAELARLRHDGTDINEPCTANVFCYSGDTGPIDPAPFMDVTTLVYEATFWEDGERKTRAREDGTVLPAVHSTVSEAIAIASQARAKELILFHVSGRHQHQCRKILREFKTPFPVSIIFPGHLFERSSKLPAAPSIS